MKPFVPDCKSSEIDCGVWIQMSFEQDFENVRDKVESISCVLAHKFHTWLFDDAKSVELIWFKN